MSGTGDPREGLGRLAAIDVGTNTIRLVVVEVTRDRRWRILDDEKVVARLGRGLVERPEFTDRAIDEAATTIGQLRTIAEGYGVDELRAIATWAVRQAANRDEFVDRVRRNAGVELEVLTAHEEARLAFLGVRSAFDLRGLNVAQMDVGGGSTEIVLASDELVDRIYPLALGAVTLTERFGTSEPGVEGFQKLRRYVRQSLRDEIGKPPAAPHLLIGTGGTFTALAAISTNHGNRRPADEVRPFNVHGYELQRSEIKHVLKHLYKLPMRDRARVAGLSPDRADIIVAGLVIVEEALKHFAINRVRVADQGVRAGLIRSMIEHRWPRVHRTPAVDRRQSVRQFAAKCRCDEAHAAKVGELAVQMLDQLAAQAAAEGGPDGWSTPETRELLLAAAELHDVGYLVNYAGHHKHSYHLIVHSDLAGFTRRELELVASIARYHRGSSPKLKHAAFARLSTKDQDVVRRLAGILRVAVALDRSHNQEIRGVHVRCQRRRIVIEAECDADPSVALWAGQRKCSLLEEAWRRKVEFGWHDRPRDAESTGQENRVLRTAQRTGEP